MQPKYIIVCVGRFADGEGTRSYQLFVLDGVAYFPLTRDNGPAASEIIGSNDPVSYATARNRLAQLEGVI